MSIYNSQETVLIDEGTQISNGTLIWHYNHVMGGAQIGEHCVLGQCVF